MWYEAPQKGRNKNFSCTFLDKGKNRTWSIFLKWTDDDSTIVEMRMLCSENEPYLFRKNNVLQLCMGRQKIAKIVCL